MYTFWAINDATRFAEGELFESPEDVRAYFERAELIGMLQPEDESEVPSQAELDAMASAVIEHRWHCAFIADREPIAAVLRELGRENPEEEAGEWVRHGIAPEEVRAWAATGCTPAAAAEMRSSGVEPELAGRVQVIRCGGGDELMETVASAVSRGAMNGPEAAHAVRHAVPAW